MSALKTALDAISARCPRPLPAPRAEQCEYMFKLQQQLSARTTVPIICGIYLDIFGFSRGAAEARVFTLEA